jgi:hypothetical protein
MAFLPNRRNNMPEALTMSEIIIYEDADGQSEVQVRLDGETVWLSQDQMAFLFERERSVITKHLRNIFKEGELAPDSVRANFAHTATDGKTYQIEHYNLDAIISVGYRVNSKRGVRFRQWATNVLRRHILQGYRLINPAWQNSGLQRLSRRWNCSPGHSMPMPW